MSSNWLRESHSGDVIHPQLWESGSGYKTTIYVQSYMLESMLSMVQCHGVNNPWLHHHPLLPDMMPNHKTTGSTFSTQNHNYLPNAISLSPAPINHHGLHSKVEVIKIGPSVQYQACTHVTINDFNRCKLRKNCTRVTYKYTKAYKPSAQFVVLVGVRGEIEDADQILYMGSGYPVHVGK